MKVPILRIPFSEEEITVIKSDIGEILRSGQLAMGKYVAEFEQRFKGFIGTDYAVATNSGTSALEIILRAIDVSGGTVIVPTNTFMATATAAVHAGARVTFTDIDISTLCMDAASLERQLTNETKAVVLVHIGGNISSELNLIRDLCADHHVPLVEDAAHAHGSTINGVKAGALGEAGAFSFYPTKILTTGEGGMITTNDSEIYQKAKMLRDHGKSDHNFNVHTEFGYNWRMSEFHAAVGLTQLDKIQWILSERRRIAALYGKHLKHALCSPLLLPSFIKSGYYKYIVYLDDSIERETLKSRLLTEFGVELTGEVYAQPVHTQPVFAKYPQTVVWNSETFENAEEACANHICLPLYPGLTDTEVAYVCDSLKEVLS